MQYLHMMMAFVCYLLMLEFAMYYTANWRTASTLLPFASFIEQSVYALLCVPSGSVSSLVGS